MSLIVDGDVDHPWLPEPELSIQLQENSSYELSLRGGIIEPGEEVIHNQCEDWRLGSLGVVDPVAIRYHFVQVNQVLEVLFHTLQKVDD